MIFLYVLKEIAYLYFGKYNTKYIFFRFYNLECIFYFVFYNVYFII